MADSKPLKQRKPRVRRQPQTERRPISVKGSKFWVTSDFYSYAPNEAQSDCILYQGYISPACSFSKTSQSNPFRLFASNYEKFTLEPTKVKLIPSTGVSAVMGYSLSLVWFPDPSESPTSVQATNLAQQGRYHKLLQPGASGSITIPATLKPLYVDPADKQPSTAFNGQFMIVCHGTPISAYTNTRYTGPLFRIEYEYITRCMGYSPGNIGVELPQTAATEVLTVSSQDGHAIIASPSALALSNSIADHHSEQFSGRAILSVIVNATEAVTSALPFPLGTMFKVGFFFLRKVTGLNGQPVFKVYKDYQSAVSDSPVRYNGRMLVGSARLDMTVVSQAPPQSVSPTTSLDFAGLVLGGTYTFNADITNQPAQIGGNFKVVAATLVSVTDTATHSKSSTVPPISQWRFTGQSSPPRTLYGYADNCLIGRIVDKEMQSRGWYYVAMDTTGVFRLLANSAGPTPLPLQTFNFNVVLDLSAT